MTCVGWPVAAATTCRRGQERRDDHGPHGQPSRDRDGRPEVLLTAAVHASVGFGVELTNEGVEFSAVSHPFLKFDILDANGKQAIIADLEAGDEDELDADRGSVGASSRKLQAASGTESRVAGCRLACSLQLADLLPLL